MIKTGRPCIRDRFHSSLSNEPPRRSGSHAQQAHGSVGFGRPWGDYSKVYYSLFSKNQVQELFASAPAAFNQRRMGGNRGRAPPPSTSAHSSSSPEADSPLPWPKNAARAVAAPAGMGMACRADCPPRADSGRAGRWGRGRRAATHTAPGGGRGVRVGVRWFCGVVWGRSDVKCEAQCCA